MDEDVDYSANATTMPPVAEEPLDPAAEIKILKTNMNDLFLVLMGAIILFMQVWSFSIGALANYINHQRRLNFSVRLCIVGSRQRPFQERHQHSDEERRRHVRWMARFLVMRVRWFAAIFLNKSPGITCFVSISDMVLPLAKATLSLDSITSLLLTSHKINFHSCFSRCRSIHICFPVPRQFSLFWILFKGHLRDDLRHNYFWGDIWEIWLHGLHNIFDNRHWDHLSHTGRASYFVE